jgi:membrane fusion protein
MNLPLFRPEVVAARRDAWLGEARLVQPLSIRLVARVCLFLIASFALYVTLGTYTRRVHAEGLLTPNVGLITLIAASAGRVSSSGVKEGDRVDKGQLLYTINLDPVSASGPTQKRVIEELGQQKASVEKQRALKAATAATDKQSLADQIRNLNDQSSQLDEQIDLQNKLVVPLRERIEVLAKALSDGLVRSADFQTQNYIYLQAST